jgi:outer membrane protein OmpA-like peptidoglycan-associated protein
MRFRTILLANAAALLTCGGALLASPAFAGEGWYVGLGAGWDELKAPDVYGDGLDGRLRARDAAIYAGTLGYKFAGLPIRVEAEGAWDSHDTRSFTDAGLAYPTEGHAEIRSVMGNALYDWQVLPRLKLSAGAGAGVGQDRIKFDDPFASGTYGTGMRSGFMWQGIGGANFAVTRSTDLFVEYHYRDLHNGANDPLRPYAVHGLTENAVMAGIRWYPWTAPQAVSYQAPPPPPPEPVAPPPPPPPPVKTFIVFFDFNKSDLTAEAQNVVSEAVKAAGQTHAVRVLVTGHTDTVGSDTYNQALSLRRALSVKNEMIREGMKSDDIATVGKSFHDPLVATGPGVREPQNRRAVIDLGG